MPFRAALKSFLDMDHLITSLVQVPTKPSIKLAEQAINHTIALRHVLRSLALVRVAVSTCKSEIPSAVGKVLDDPRLGELEVMIDEAINEDVGFQKSALGIRNQRCYAIKVGNWELSERRGVL